MYFLNFAPAGGTWCPVCRCMEPVCVEWNRANAITFLDGGEPEQLDKTKIIPSYDHLVIKGGVGGVDIIELGVLGPNPIDLCTQHTRP